MGRDNITKAKLAEESLKKLLPIKLLARRSIDEKRRRHKLVNNVKLWMKKGT